MKITAVFLLAACLSVSAAGHSQRVTLSVKDAPLEKVFREIQRQTGYDFLFTRQMLKDTRPVSMDVKDMSLNDALNICLKDQPVGFSIEDDAIVISRKDPPGSPIPARNGEGEARAIDISGKVIDKDGNPLQGATISVKGSDKLMTRTDVNGVFVLKGLSADDVIVISYAEYKSQSFKVGSTTNFMVKLEADEKLMGEVIINKGYYTEKQKNSLANVGHVGAKDIEKQPVTNPLLALQGRVAGLVVTQNTGVPGGGVTVRIQGTNSIANGNDPLIVVDGVPYPSQLLSTTRGGRGANSFGQILGNSGSDASAGNPLNYINPADIEAIDVLKDADATAIYGSRAANGAILITTKRGKTGKMKVDLNLQHGWGKVGKHVDMLNTEQYIMMRREAFKNDGLALPARDPNATYEFDLTIWDTTRYTDWQKELIGGIAQYNNFNLGVSGGTNNVQYRVGGTYNRTTTVFRNDQPTSNASLNFNLNTVSANQKFRLKLGGSYLFNAINLPLNDLTYQAITTAPNAPKLYNDDGSLNWEPNAAGSSTWWNPLSLQQAIYESRTNNLVSNSVLSYQILPGLEVKSSFGYNQIQANEFFAPLASSSIPEGIPYLAAERQAAYTNSRISSWIAEPQLSYHRALGKGNIDFLLGGSFQSKKNAGESITGKGYSSDQVLRDFRSATKLSLTTLYSQYKYAAVFGRINYNWSDKYLLNLTMRRDGSSRFGPENRYHNFGAVAAGWVFTGEHFVERALPWLSFGKIKGSFGTTGSDQIGDYTFLNLYSASPFLPYQGVVGITGGVFNPYLAWEETKKLQGGIELGFLKDRIMLSAVYARNRSSNQLLRYSLPIMTGVSTIFTNFPATVENTSWEFSLNSVNLKNKNFSWESNFNLTLPRNKMVVFPNLEKSSYANSLIVGQPLGTIKTFAYSNVDPVTGLYMVYDKDGKPTLTPSYPDDLTRYITAAVKFYGGFENRFSFKGFQLDFLVQFAQQQNGNDLFAFFTDPGRFRDGAGNQPVIVLRRWQNPGDIADVQQFSNNSLPTTYGDHFNTDDVWYLKLRNLSFSYQLPKRLSEKVHTEGCSVYLRGQNLYTFTNYDGFDPEVSGIETLPPLRVITVGAQINF
ncbi:MAG TPA: SusC/RagA family TonB-linked outer membrane protein [Chitinophagaceae bacterium]|nr:SusC/RagA family TonB-linked outer membrane protein [Chitinophagaceae bacterium]